MRYIHHQWTKENIDLVSKLAKKYDIEKEVVYKDEPCSIVYFNRSAFKLVEEVASEVYPGVGMCPYVMTGINNLNKYRYNSILTIVKLNNTWFGSHHKIPSEILW